MKVGELVRLLSALDQDLKIVFSNENSQETVGVGLDVCAYRYTDEERGHITDSPEEVGETLASLLAKLEAPVLRISLDFEDPDAKPA